MKKLALVVALATSVTVATAGEKEAADMLYRDAQPLWKVGAVIDSKGCLWGLTEDHGVPTPIRIVDHDKKPICHNVEK
ncbi:conserved exported hypothetical protein [Burkholderia diffusa]|uniref:hypothetical protein n=1 Tax=Burkholderia diffusa TaxID=488732 RepID=UPI001CB26220|nr:hypothetical protein [Burkholderia diffusa]CAG9264223.1 conserved exported hypothetical protein [Burkholderia diffusa]